MPLKRCFNCMNELSESVKTCPKCGFDNSRPNQPAQALPCGTILHGRYLIGRMLGQGGFGITYIGYDYTLETPVCIKEFFPSGGAMRDPYGNSKVYWSSDSTGAAMKLRRETFVKEAQKAAKVRSLASVVNVWDVFYENETAYIVMEYIKGITVKDYLIKRGTVMDAGECFELLGPVIRDLQGVHEKGIVHRDISPDNLMIDEDGKVKLLDLGAAKDLSKGTGQSSALVAKKGFSPPEQYATSMNIGPWTDVYAMCATIYWCMTGKMIPEAMERMIDDTLSYPESIPVSIASVLKRGLAVRSRDRIQDMKELEAVLVGKIKPPKGPDKNLLDSIRETTNGERRFPVKIFCGIAAIVILAVVLSNISKISQNAGGGGTTQEATTDNYESEKEQNEEENETAGSAVASGTDASAGKSVETEPSASIPNFPVPAQEIPTSIPQEIPTSIPGETKPGGGQQSTEQAVISGILSKYKFTKWADRNAEEIVFLNTFDGTPSDAEDLSEAGDRGILGWKDGKILYIAGKNGVRAPVDCRFLFSDEEATYDDRSKCWNKLTTVTGAEYFDMSQVNSMNGMFEYCESLTSVDVGSWDTSNVESMQNMFQQCKSLLSLDVSKWNISNVKDISGLFYGCESLTSLNVGNWDTSSVNNVYFLFCDCKSLTTIDVSRWIISNVGDTMMMFSGCSNLKELDVSKWNTKNLKEAYRMFAGCISLTTLDVSNWDTSNCTNMSYMFQNCSNLERLDVSNWDTSSLINSVGMFDKTIWEDNPPF